MRRVTLSSRIENHQWRFFVVEAGVRTEISRDEMLKLYNAKIEAERGRLLC